MNNSEAASILRQTIGINILRNGCETATESAMKVAVNALDEDGRVCEWRDIGCGIWDAGCENQHRFEEGGPADNLHEFCPYCGGRLEVVE